MTTPSHRIAMALRTTSDRAKTLWDDGYKPEPTNVPFLIFVRRPSPVVNMDTGEVLVDGYHVNLLEDSTTCECPLFRRAGDCKHRLAVLELWRDTVNLFGPSLGLVPNGVTE